MANSTWTWAHLNHEQLKMVEEAEQTLGNNVHYLVAYQAVNSAGGLSPTNLRVAPLNESQIECLQGLEARLQSVVVAYQ